MRSGLSQAAQDGRTVPSEAAGHSVADNWEVQTVSKRQFSFRRNQLLECLQEAEKVISECGINKQISFHCSRHTFGTLALSKGMPIESVSRVLGHTNIKTTQIYAKITTQKLGDDLTAFGNQLNQTFGNIKVAGT